MEVGFCERCGILGNTEIMEELTVGNSSYLICNGCADFIIQERRKLDKYNSPMEMNPY